MVHIAVGRPAKENIGEPTVHAVWNGWSGGVAVNPIDRLTGGPEFVLAGVLSGAIAVSEAFQSARDNPVAAQRDIGLSLWRPDLDWLDKDAIGPACGYLPKSVWMLGLGHLGQAYAWGLGFLPYPTGTPPMIYLQDFDTVVEANESTGLLTSQDSVGKTKARVVAQALESIGIETRITERAFDSHTKRTAGEPGIALAGFDDPAPRKLLERANFLYVVDAGLGGGPEHYNEMTVHSFPSSIKAESAFASTQKPSKSLDQSAYRELVDRGIRIGQTPGEAECGVLQIADRTVGAAFVGAVAASLAIAEALRILNEGPRYEVIDLSLRSPRYREAIRNSSPGPFSGPGYITSDTPELALEPT